MGHVIDVLPTVLELAGIEHDEKYLNTAPSADPGRSLVSVLKEGTPINPRQLRWSHENHRALRDGDWKLVKTKQQDDWELFDLSVDRAETNNLAGMHPERVKGMAKAWEELEAGFVEALVN